MRIAWFERLAASFGEPFGMTGETFAKKTVGASYSQLQDLADDLKRQHVLRPGVQLRRLSAERIARWREVTALEAHA